MVGWINISFILKGRHVYLLSGLVYVNGGAAHLLNLTSNNLIILKSLRWAQHKCGDFIVLRLFQADLHQQLPWQLDNSLTQRKGRQSSLLVRCFFLPILKRLLLRLQTFRYLGYGGLI